MSTEIKKPRFIKSQDTSIIEGVLRAMPVGGVVTYDQLSAALGRDVRKHCRANLTSARRTLVAEGIFFSVEANVGLTRLSQQEAVTDSERYVSRAKSAARNGMRQLQNVDTSELDDESKRSYVTKSAQLGAIQLFSSSKATKKIEGVVRPDSQPIAIGETLKLFGG